jgi:hypothetical protein
MDDKGPRLLEQEVEEVTQTADSWLVRRQTLVRQALDDEDFDTLRRVAGLPGGFGTDELRKRVW